MPKVGCSVIALLVAFSLSPVAFGEDIAFEQSRPLFGLTSELQQKYGLLVTYEDGPVDRDSELNSETRPNGLKFLCPMWRPITFRLPSDLTLRDQTVAFAPVRIDPAQSLAAVQELVKQYNDSENPGKFTVVPDGQYLHIVQTQRMAGGKLQAVEPVTNTVVSLDRTPRSCNAVLIELFAQVRQLRGVNMTQGVMPIASLFLHECRVGEGPLTTRQVRAEGLAAIGTDRIDGQKRVSFSWELVYDPNWNMYALSIVPVQVHDPLPPADAPRPAADSSGSTDGGRSVRTFRAPSPGQPKN